MEYLALDEIAGPDNDDGKSDVAEFALEPDDEPTDGGFDGEDYAA